MLARGLTFVCAQLFFCAVLTAQNFTWMKGINSPTIAAFANYGTMGVPAAANTPGGRYNPAMWYDNNGNIWAFGGEGFSATSSTGFHNDLWRYTISTNMWTHMKGSTLPGQYSSYGTQGIPGAGNNPGSRSSAASWIDNNGNLWLYGGYAHGGVTYWFENDLWKYTIATNQWTWMGGGSTANPLPVYGTQGVPAVTNNPGSRAYSMSWKDNSGDLWLFGGRKFQSGQSSFNDLWRYHISTNEWTWMKGANTTTASAGVYGTMGVPASTNTPGGRSSSCTFQDQQGNFWLYSGVGNSLTVSSNIDFLTDLWKYEVSTNNWTWMNGTTSVYQTPAYGTQGVPSATNHPGSRVSSIGWTDAVGDFWLLGGNGLTTSTTGGIKNDLWKYKLSTGEWTWVKGPQTANDPGVYGTATVPAPANIPAGRCQAAGVTDNAGNLWLFAGGGTAGSGPWFNDLWRYDVCYTPPTPTSVTAPANLQVCAGSSATLSVNSNTAGVQWFSSPTSTAVLGTGNSFITTTLTANTSFYAEGISCTNSASRTAIQVTVNPNPTVTAYSGAICTGNSFTINPSGASSYTYSGGSAIVSPVSTTSYTITGSNSFSCVNTVPVVITVTVGNSLNVSVSGSPSVCTGGTVQLTANGAATYSWNNSSTSNTISVAPSSATNYTLTGYSGTCTSTYVHTVNVLPLPNIVVSNAAICIGSSHTLNPSGAATYTNLNGAAVVTPTITTTYSIIGTDNNGCTSNLPALATITVNALPVVTANSSTTSVCAGSTIVLTGGGAHTYTWTGGASNGVPYIPTASTTFSVQGSNTLTGCSSTNAAAVSIIVKPAPPINASATPTLICAGESATLTASGATSFVWNDLGNNSSYTVSPPADMVYTLTGTGTNNCSATTTVGLMIDPCTGLIEQTGSSVFSLFPNPANDYILLQTEKGSRNSHLLIYNSLGQVLHQYVLTGDTDLIKLSLEKGIYYYEVYSEKEKRHSGKLLIE